MSLTKPHESKKAKVIPWGDHVVNGRNRPTVASTMMRRTPRKPMLETPEVSSRTSN